MKIRDFFYRGAPVLSFEVFPPKREGNLEQLYGAVRELITLEPDFISVTYGAGGSTRDKTVDIASKIKNDMGVEALAHLTCVESTRQDIDEILDELERKNIENVLALRGDPPKDSSVFIKPADGFGYANELVSFIGRRLSFSIGVAGYPDGHAETPSLEIDIANLKRKVDAGADFIISQLFFVNDVFYRFRDMANKVGITAPIVPGIFPVFNYSQLEKIAQLCGKPPEIPETFRSKLEKMSHKSDECEKYGIEFAIKQSSDLLSNSVSGLHYYCMNKSSHIKGIVPHVDLTRHTEKTVESLGRS
ncbi:MAG: methylenetetrahydrofolate reductase [NAD(P)H] [Deltaproteobacteria bacterium]|nr:methylenetetrahydrofolate reductase [NAD(P)H] [Deltaproteobacteria bacterium]